MAEQLQKRGIALWSLTESIDTSTKRTRAGLQAAVARGRRGGRPPVLDKAKITAAKAMLASGNMSAIEVALQLGCAPSTLYRHLPGGRAALGIGSDEQAAA